MVPTLRPGPGGAGVGDWHGPVPARRHLTGRSPAHRARHKQSVAAVGRTRPRNPRRGRPGRRHPPRLKTTPRPETWMEPMKTDLTAKARTGSAVATVQARHLIGVFGVTGFTLSAAAPLTVVAISASTAFSVIGFV